MQLGWIDFSEQEKERVLDVIQLLQEPSAVDELGIGVIRDGFANYFFPGTSTVQTRAKYFLIVPYVLKEAGEGKFGTDINRIIKQIDEEERKCGLKLIEGDKDGVIGSLVLPNSWVARKPSNIYWNGIKRFGIFKGQDLSVKEYLAAATKLKKLKGNSNLGNRNDIAEENEKDDRDAGDFMNVQFWNLPGICQSDWRTNLTISLLQEEAVFLRKQITTELSGTLFAHLVKNNITVRKYEGFKALADAVYDDVPEATQTMINLANAFNNLVYLARIRYNMILTCGKNVAANDEWYFYKNDIPQMADVNLDLIYEKLGIMNFRLEKFLKALKEAFINGNIGEADRLIRKQEIDLKGASRAKLNRVGEYPTDGWVGGGWLDYRFSTAKRLINDIYQGEGLANV